MYHYSKVLSSLGHFDVVVVGSGAAGSTAAIAAARAGAKTALIERHGFLGGTSTAVLDTFYGFYTPGKHSHKVVGGVADDVVDGLKRFGQVFERPNTFGAGTGITYHPEYLKVVWETLVDEAQATPYLYTSVQDVLLDDRAVSGLVLATKGGLFEITARTFVDASGDADICAFAGVPFELAGDKEPAQTLTTTFKMVNVDQKSRGSITKEELHSLMEEAANDSGYHLPRREGSDHRTPVTGMVATIMTRLPGHSRTGAETVNASDPVFLSHSEIEGRRQALEYIRFLTDRVPGYKDASLSHFGTQIGVRETRRIYGAYRLTTEDVLSARQFDDQIALCGAPIEDHHPSSDTKWRYLPEGKTVGIPYRTLLPQEISNVLVAGRCFSAEHSAHASVRSMGQCMAMGHAAGVAAAMASDEGCPVDEVDVGRVQELLRRTNAILEEPVTESV